MKVLNKYSMNHEAAIEQYQHVVNRLQSFWGHPEFLEYHTQLTTTDRPNRQGFPLEVITEISFLHDLYISHYLIINRFKMSASQEVELRRRISNNNDVWGIV